MSAKKVYHKKCGGYLGTIVRYEPGAIRRAKEFVRADGSSPDYGEIFNEFCPQCRMRVAGFGDMEYRDA